MNYRGIVKNGVVVLETGAALPEGQPVEITALPTNSSATTNLPGFGLWQDRDDIADAAEESLRLRRLIEHPTR